MIEENKAELILMMSVGLIIIIALLLIPSFSADTIFLNSGSGSGNATGETTECFNVGNGVFIIKNSTSGNCFVRSVIGSADILVTNSSNTIIIDFNGTAGSETTQCINVGGATLIIKNSTSGNCFVKSLVGGTGITISNGTNTITITNSSPESTDCSNVGTGNKILKTTPIDCVANSLIAGTGISITNTTDDYTFANTLPEATACANVGTGNKILKTTPEDCTANSLIAGTGITITNTTDDYTFASQCTNTGTGEAICESGNNINSLLVSSPLILTDTVDELRLVILTNATSPYIPKPIIAKIGTVIPATTTGDLIGLFFGSVMGGTETFGDDTDGVRIQTTTGTTAGTDAGVATANAIFHNEWNAYLHTKVQALQLTGGRMFIGFMSTANTLPNTDTPCANRSCAGFYINTTSTVYQIVVNDGDATENLLSTGVTENTAFHNFEIIGNINRFGFSLDGSTPVFINTEIPATTTDLFCVIAYETSDAVSDTFEYYHAYVQEDR